MSVEVQVAYYTSVEGTIEKLQIVLVFLEHQFRLQPKEFLMLSHETSNYRKKSERTQCIGTIDYTHAEIAELNEHYSDYINRKDYFSLKVQAVSD